TKGIGQGSGLGLAVVQGIIQRHDGFIDVTSVPGAGTEFLMYLPLSEDVHVVSSSRDQEFHEIPGGSETILFVDDEPQLRESALEFLSVKGYRVLLAADGDEALSVYDRHRHEIALVLSDYGLPKYSGEELHDRIAVQNPHVRFVLLTGFLEPNKREDLLRKGINSIMMKPYKPTDILKQIRLVLS
ncbi:MAG: response regulator, partial [Bacteroidetes bacterium]|nr:response regulator [Bacteroidota bacterium]